MKHPDHRNPWTIPISKTHRRICLLENNKMKSGDEIKFYVYNSLRRLCGGGIALANCSKCDASKQVSNSFQQLQQECSSSIPAKQRLETKWLRELEDLAHKSVSFPNK